MSEHDVLKKNRNFYIGVGGTVLEGLLSGSLFMLLYSVMQFLWSGQFDMNRVLVLTCVIAVVFLLRILIYSYGYTKAQIGGAEVSKNTRLFMGDHLKRIPLSRFTQGQTGDYINTITSDVNNYEKILTHKIGDMAKSFALSLMLIIFVMTIYVPAGIILLIADLLLIPGLWLSFRMVRKYGKEKNDLGVTGMTVTQVMGCGVQKGAGEKYRGVEMDVTVLPKVKVEVIVGSIPVDKVIETVKRTLYTGHVGDGKIFVYNVQKVVKVRTGEEDYDALKDVE